nr:hypothetical protein [Nonomuraea sp. FMUSA5-5]
MHYGRAAAVRDRRAVVLAAAHATHPERFASGVPTPPGLPGPAWINKPKTTEPKDDTEKTTQN